MKQIRLGVVVGSGRKESFCRKVADALTGFMPEHVQVTVMEITELPMFNQDYDDEGRTPPEWVRFREAVMEQDGYLFVTPEYNRSFPPLLKNALDIASRPYGQNRWGGKPGAVVSVSPGALGGFGANHHLRQVLTFLDVYLMQQPELYIGGIADLLDEQGQVNNESTQGFLKMGAESIVRWMERF